MEYMTCIYTQDPLDKSITLSVVEMGGSEQMSVENGFNTFKCLALSLTDVFKITTEEV